MLKLSTKSRRLQPFQAYSRLYYDTKLKPIIDEKYKEYTETVPEDEQKTRFVFSAALTKTLFEAETEEVKREVEEFRKKQESLGTIQLKEEDEEVVVDEAAQDERNRQMQS